MWEQSSVMFCCQNNTIKLKRCNKSDQIICISSEQPRFGVWREATCEKTQNEMVWLRITGSGVDQTWITNLITVPIYLTFKPGGKTQI